MDPQHTKFVLVILGGVNVVTDLDRVRIYNNILAYTSCLLYMYFILGWWLGLDYKHANFVVLILG